MSEYESGEQEEQNGEENMEENEEENEQNNQQNNQHNSTQNEEQESVSGENNNNKNSENSMSQGKEEGGDNPEILYEEFFNYFLPARKNSLNIKECKNAMRCLGLVVTEREIQEFLEIKEKTGKEKINLEDFKSVCNKKFNETNNNLAELEEAFEMLDPEKTGIVDSVVLRHQMKIFKPKITDEEINQILSEFGEDKNGNINYREYLRNIKS